MTGILAGAFPSIIDSKLLFLSESKLSTKENTFCLPMQLVCLSFVCFTSSPEDNRSYNLFLLVSLQNVIWFMTKFYQLNLKFNMKFIFTTKCILHHE